MPTPDPDTQAAPPASSPAADAAASTGEAAPAADTCACAEEAQTVEAVAGIPAVSPRTDKNYAAADKVIKDHMLAALGIGLLPIPVIDLALFAGSGTYMVKRLCTIYGVPFKANAARGILSAIGSTLGAVGVTTGVALSAAKLIPGIGTAAALVSLPVANAAFTYVVGKVFIAHFESGGTLLDFNIKDYLEYIKETAVKGKDVAASMLKKKEQPPSAAA